MGKIRVSMIEILFMRAILKDNKRALDLTLKSRAFELRVNLCM